MKYFYFPEAEFQTLQTEFMEKYYIEFEDTEENKFIYTDIHNEYVRKISVIFYFVLNYVRQTGST